MDNTELELEKIELEEKLNRSRNDAEKCELADKIKAIDKEIYDANNKAKKEAVVQKEAPSRADHKDSKSRVSYNRGDIVNSGDTFVGIL